jgi:enoyl-CoA hydratase/carnithine racemase
MGYESIVYAVGDDHVATITLNRPDKLNAFNRVMLDEFVAAWTAVREDDGVHTVVVQGAGDRAFSAGLDVTDPRARAASTATVPFGQRDPGMSLGPKANRVWKPVVCAVHGTAGGGAFYWINESDIVICSDDAQFFDPHVTYGMTSALEPIGLRWRIPLGEALRWALMGLDERMTADRALQIGLVSEVVPRAQLAERAHQIAATIAAKPTVATQGTVRAIWESLDMGRTQALNTSLSYVQLGNAIGEQQVNRSNVERPTPRLR